MKSAVLTSVLLVLVPLCASAQTQTISSEIVVTASALPENVESTPAAVTVLTRKDIDDREARDIADLLRDVPGLSVSRTGSPGRATSLFTRGANSTHTLVLWNGIEINNPFFAGYDWGRFSTAGVQQVEIVRGPYSALYGSDAVAGVVNVLTTPVRSGIEADAEAGGNGLRNGNAGGSYVAGNLSANGSFESRRDDGFAANDDFAQNSGLGSIRWSGDHLGGGISARHTSYKLGIPIDIDAAGDALVPSPNRRQSGNENQIAVPFDVTAGALTAELLLAGSRQRDDFRDPDDPFGTVWSTTEASTRRARLTTHTATSIGTIVAGGEIERALVDDQNNFGPNLTGKRRDERSLYLEDRYSADLAGRRLEVSAGARYDDYGEFGSETSPRLAIAWLAGMTKLRAAYGEAFRAPSVGELYFPFSGNTDLHAERSRSFEIGADWYLARSSVSVTVFRSHFRDLIMFDNATYRFANVGLADSRGIELSASRHFVPNLSAVISYTFLQTDQDRTGKPLLRRPRNSGSVVLTYDRAAWNAGVAVTYTGRRDDILPVLPFSRVSDKAFSTADLIVQWHVGRVIPYAKLENATDARYEEVRGYPSPGRRASAGIRFIY